MLALRGSDSQIGMVFREKQIMQTVIRTYSGKGAKELFDVLERPTADEGLLRSFNGLVGYALTRSSDGGFSVTVCQDKAGVDESVQKAKGWIANNVDIAAWSR
jgi:hypothetical protein